MPPGRVWSRLTIWAPIQVPGRARCCGRPEPVLLTLGTVGSKLAEPRHRTAWKPARRRTAVPSASQDPPTASVPIDLTTFPGEIFAVRPGRGLNAGSQAPRLPPHAAGTA